MGCEVVIVFDVVYYGNMGVFVDFLLYKYDGSGGCGVLVWVYVVFLFDLYCG